MRRAGTVGAGTGLTALLTFLLAVPVTEARGESPRIVSGGPKGKTAQAQVVRSLNRASRALSVCWRGKRPDAVTVALAVDARGEVTSSRQKTRGAVAQCAAGVLAVQTVAATGASYRVTVSLSTSASGRSGPSGSGRIDAALAAHRSALEGCHERAKARDYAGGEVTLRFLIRPDGSIVDPAVAASRLGDARVERCLLDTLKAARLGAGVTDKTVSYSLRLRMPGKGDHRGGDGTTKPGAKADSSLQPRKDGPLAGSVISTAMRKRKADFSACYDAQARRDRTLAGRVVLRFTVRGNGRVSNVKVRETTLNNAKVERCMVKVGETLTFPAEAGRAPTRVFYPFAFSSR